MEYKIGKVIVSEEIYKSYQKEKLTWQIYHLGIFWIGVFLFSFLGMLFWVKYLDGENGVRKQGYIEACKDFYKGKLKADLIKNEDGTTDWKWIGLEK